MATASLPAFGTLTKNLHVDVVVVGAGITGLTTAYLLGRAGKNVAILDDGAIASGETERTSAHLSSVLGSRYFLLEGLHGERGAQLVAASHSAAIDEIERIVAEEKIDCGFERVDGYLFAPAGEPPDLLERELAAVHRAGLRGVELVARAPLGKVDTGPALRFPQQAQFHPLQYLAAVGKAIARDGGQIFTQTHVSDIKGGELARVETAGGWTVTAHAVVMATNTPVNDWLVIHTKQAAYRSFVIGATVPHGAVTKALYWDTLDPYHYVRLQSFQSRDAAETVHDLLLIGGEDHKTGQEDDAEARYFRLEQWARERFPIGDIKLRWSGQIVESMDGLAFIGPNPLDRKNIFVATGDSGNGLTHGTIAGLLLTDLILGRENPWAKLYDPSRVTLRAANTFAKEAINMAAQYGDWLTPGDVKTENDVAPNSGAVIRHGATKVAAFRDGELHECSAICPHLGGIVRWNHSEKTWDCPCHGSRFDRFGKVLNGPAITDLHSVAHPAEVSRS